MNEHFFIFNGSFYKKKDPVLSSGHAGLLYGDGLFETMRLYKGMIINRDLHFSRLLTSVSFLELHLPVEKLHAIFQRMNILAQKNKNADHVRIRLTILRAENSFSCQDNPIDYFIESFPIEEPMFDSNGITAAIYNESFKGTGRLANLKSNNYLLSVLAKRFAAGESADEGIILNAFGRICETSVANIFFAENGKLFTPSLSEGCVDGTARHYVIQCLQADGHTVTETPCTVDRLSDADEVFITNAIKWVQPVRSIGKKQLRIEIAGKIFEIMQSQLL